MLFNGIYRKKRVFVTGHTGFKGAWLSLWLRELGAEVVGYSLAPHTDPNHFDLLKLDMRSVIADIRDNETLDKTMKACKPDIVLHMAAQPLVRDSYKRPFETYEINVMGSINVFEAVRKTESVRAVVNVTSDKCYDNKEWVWGYRESDPMGGYDPYSASKGCAELVTSSYRNSYFHPGQYGKSHRTLMASVRAGNVVGGGDWAQDRLIPDIVRAASRGEKVLIRSPKATRPWQFVLEPLSGYLLVGQKLLEGKAEFAEAWNFGPEDGNNIDVETMVRKIQPIWDRVGYDIQRSVQNPHEANFLKLDCSKARKRLGWKPLWGIDETLTRTLKWYKRYYQNGKINSLADLKAYEKALSASA